MNNRIVSLLTVLLCTSVISVCGNKDSEIVPSSHGKKLSKSLLKKERNNKSDEQNSDEQNYIFNDSGTKNSIG